jgi:hypothetical protein
MATEKPKIDLSPSLFLNSVTKVAKYDVFSDIRYQYLSVTLLNCQA